jgi:hypothetical protein
MDFEFVYIHIANSLFYVMGVEKTRVHRNGFCLTKPERQEVISSREIYTHELEASSGYAYRHHFVDIKEELRGQTKINPGALVNANPWV